VPEFHRLALQLSPQVTEGTLISTHDYLHKKPVSPSLTPFEHLLYLGSASSAPKISGWMSFATSSKPSTILGPGRSIRLASLIL